MRESAYPALECYQGPSSCLWSARKSCYQSPGCVALTRPRCLPSWETTAFFSRLQPLHDRAELSNSITQDGDATKGKAVLGPQSRRAARGITALNCSLVGSLAGTARLSLARIHDLLLFGVSGSRRRWAKLREHLTRTQRPILREKSTEVRPILQPPGFMLDRLRPQFLRGRQRRERVRCIAKMTNGGGRGPGCSSGERHRVGWRAGATS